MRSLLVLALLAAFSANAEERTVLDAPEKHVAAAQYRAARSVVAGGRAGGGWQLTAGAAIEATAIDVTLRNVRGSVTLRADPSRLEPLVRRERVAALRDAP